MTYMRNMFAPLCLSVLTWSQMIRKIKYTYSNVRIASERIGFIYLTTNTYNSHTEDSNIWGVDVSPSLDHWINMDG